MELKVNAFNSLEDKQLICFLFFHDQVFAANYRQEIFTWGNLHADYLVWLSGFCFKQLDGNLWNLFEGLGVINIDFINLRHHKSVVMGELNTDWAL